MTATAAMVAGEGADNNCNNDNPIMFHDDDDRNSRSCSRRRPIDSGRISGGGSSNNSRRGSILLLRPMMEGVLMVVLSFVVLLFLSNNFATKSPISVSEAWTPMSTTKMMTTRGRRRRIPGKQYNILARTSRSSISSLSSTIPSSQSPHPSSPSVSSKQDNEQEKQPTALRSLFPSWTVDNYPEIQTVNGTIDVTGDGDEGQQQQEQDHALFYKVFYGTNYQRKLQQQQQHDDSNSNSDELRIALFLHGGPGAGCTDNHVRFFDATKWDVVVLLDQRGCGQSYSLSSERIQKSNKKPPHVYNPLINNTLLDLVEDCERIRQHLQIEQWTTILGGSWGTTLALAYGQMYPTTIKSLILRGMCTMRQSEIDWLFTNGGSSSAVVASQDQQQQEPVEDSGFDDDGDNDSYEQQRQKMWEQFEKGSLGEGNTESNHNDIVDPRRRALGAYHELFTTGSSSSTSSKQKQQQPNIVARSWFQWEMFMSVSHKLESTKSAGDSSDAMTDMRQRIQQFDQDIQAKFNASDPFVGVASIVKTKVNQSVRDNDHDDEDSTTIIDHEWTLQDSHRRYRHNLETKQVADIVEGLRQGIADGTDPKSLSTTSSMVTTPLVYDESKSSTFVTNSDLSRQVLLTCHYSYYRDHCMNGIELLDKTRMRRLIDPTSSKIEKIVIVQGGMDRICPPDTALDLLQTWTDVVEEMEQRNGDGEIQQTLEVRIPLKAGHSMYDQFITHELVEATDRIVETTLFN